VQNLLTLSKGAAAPMQPSHDPRMLVIALAGLPITIALLLSFEHQPVTEKHLCSMLGKTDKTIASALHKLKEFQIITRTTQGWTITENYQLPLMAIREPVDNLLIKRDNLLIKRDNLLIKSRKNSDFLSSSVVVVDSRDPQNISESTTTTTKESEKFRLLKKTCILAGIHEPKASTIARMPGMTTDMIARHVENALDEGLQIGAAIFRIENEWPVKTKPDPGEIRRRKYGRFSGDPNYDD
jgi:hypothetical protein